MKSDIWNNLEVCPARCDDADITVDWEAVLGMDLKYRCVRVVIDCRHSGVCGKRDCGHGKA